MRNAPNTDLPAEAIAMLREADESLFQRGRGVRFPKSKMRDLLKRRGLIYSRPPNDNPLMRAIAGHGHAWFLTESGRVLLQYLDA